MANRPFDDIAAVPQAEHDRADFLGAVVPLRALREIPLSVDADLSNVISFRRRRPSEERDAPAVAIDASNRIAPRWSRRGRIGFALLLAGSAVLHAALFMYFDREPEPLASIGVQSVSVELVLGSNTNMGAAQKPSPNEGNVETRYNPSEQKPEDVKVETAEKQPDEVRPEKPLEETKATPDTKPTESVNPEKKPTEVFKTAAAETKPVDLPKPTEPEVAYETPLEAKPLQAEPTPEPQQAELVADPKQTEQPTIMAPEPSPKRAEPTLKKEQPAAVKEPAKKPRPTKLASNTGKDANDRTTPASEANSASRGVGIGRSDLDTNYRGIVSSHLGRYKKYPTEARSRGEQGKPTVAFSLDGQGAVTSARLARTSGFASLDQEVVAMVHRASPFPPPPDHRAQTFSIQINFDFY